MHIIPAFIFVATLFRYEQWGMNDEFQEEKEKRRNPYLSRYISCHACCIGFG